MTSKRTRKIFGPDAKPNVSRLPRAKTLPKDQRTDIGSERQIRSGQRKALRVAKALDSSSDGHITMLPDRNSKGLIRGRVFGGMGVSGGASINPYTEFSKWFRRRLARTLYTRPDIKIYGPDGTTLIATYNPETRVRTPINAPAARSSDPQES